MIWLFFFSPDGRWQWWAWRVCPWACCRTLVSYLWTQTCTSTWDSRHSSRTNQGTENKELFQAGVLQQEPFTTVAAPKAACNGAARVCVQHFYTKSSWTLVARLECIELHQKAPNPLQSRLPEAQTALFLTNLIIIYISWYLHLLICVSNCFEIQIWDILSLFLKRKFFYQTFCGSCMLSQNIKLSHCFPWAMCIKTTVATKQAPAHTTMSSCTPAGVKKEKLNLSFSEGSAGRE